MQELNTTALAKNTSTPSLAIAVFGKLAVAYIGDLNGETITMEGSVDGGSNWDTLYPGDSASTAETYTNSADSIRTRLFYLPPGMEVRWTMSNGAGTPANVYVLYGGEAGIPR